jgi:hypothetical protein
MNGAYYDIPLPSAMQDSLNFAVIAAKYGE